MVIKVSYGNILYFRVTSQLLQGLTRLACNPSGLTKEQTTQTMDPSPKTIGLRHYPRQWNLELIGAARLPLFQTPDSSMYM